MASWESATSTPLMVILSRKKVGPRTLAQMAHAPINATLAKKYATQSNVSIGLSSRGGNWNRVRVNQRICFPPNVFHIPLPARLQWVEPAGRGSGKRKTFGGKCIR